RARRVAGDRAAAGRCHRRARRPADPIGRGRAGRVRLHRALRARRRPAGTSARERASQMTLELLGWPLAAALVLAGIHAWLGLPVRARGVIFVASALARLAALGATVPRRRAHPPRGAGASGSALGSPAGGAALLAALRDRPALARATIPAEAVIGIVYAVA